MTKNRLAHLSLSFCQELENSRILLLTGIGLSACQTGVRIGQKQNKNTILFLSLRLKKTPTSLIFVQKVNTFLVNEAFFRFYRVSRFLAEGAVYRPAWASAGTALMAVGCAMRRKLAYVSTAQANDIKTRRVCPPQGVFTVFVFSTKNHWG